MDYWFWPQYVMAGMMAVSCLAQLLKAYTETPGRALITVIMSAVMAILQVWILHCGGFW